MAQLITKWITDAAVDKDKLNADVAGNGIAGGAGTALSVDPDVTGGANLAEAINVSANGVSVKVDDSTIEDNGSGPLRVKPDGITATEVDETDDYTYSGGMDLTSATTSVATPTQNAHACTKAYADSLRNASVVKENCVAVAVADVTISGVTSPIDGATIVADDRVLLTNNTDASENGIWIVSAGAWSRPTDFDTGDGASGARIFIDEGSTYQDTVWECTDNDGSDVIDTNDLAFTQRPIGEVNTAGTGLTKSGTEIRVNDGSTGNVNGLALGADTIAAAVDDSSIEIASNVLAIKALGVDTAELAATAVTAAKLGSDVSGVGLGGGNGAAIDLDIPSLTDEATVADADTIAIYDATAGAHREMTRANFLSGVGSGATPIAHRHVITSGEVTNGYLTLAQTPSVVTQVTCAVHSGIEQFNKQWLSAAEATPDFDILSTNQFHFNNNGAATGLSEDMVEGDVLILRYAY